MRLFKKKLQVKPDTYAAACAATTKKSNHIISEKTAKLTDELITPTTEYVINLL